MVLAGGSGRCRENDIVGKCYLLGLVFSGEMSHPYFLVYVFPLE